MKSFLKISAVLISVILMEYCFMLTIAKGQETKPTTRQELLKIIPESHEQTFSLRIENSQTVFYGTWRVLNNPLIGSYDLIEVEIGDNIYMSAISLGSEIIFARFITKEGVLAEIIFNEKNDFTAYPPELSAENAFLYGDFARRLVQSAIRGLKIESDEDLKNYIVRIKKATKS